MAEDKKDILDSIMETEDKKKKLKKKSKKTKIKKKVESSNAIEKAEKITDVVQPEEDAVLLPSSPVLISKLKNSVFQEDIHYIKQIKKGNETIFFKKQASSVLAELFGVDVRIISCKIESYIPPAVKYVIDELFESIRVLIKEGKMKQAGNLIEYSKELALDKNPAEWWRAEIVLEADNGKRKLQWTGSATNALENVAVSAAMTRTFRNLIRIFGGL